MAFSYTLHESNNVLPFDKKMEKDTSFCQKQTQWELLERKQEKGNIFSQTMKQKQKNSDKKNWLDNQLSSYAISTKSQSTKK